MSFEESPGFSRGEVQGRCTLPYGFYHDQPRDATGAGSTTQCRSCMGRGLLWRRA